MHANYIIQALLWDESEGVHNHVVYSHCNHIICLLSFFYLVCTGAGYIQPLSDRNCSSRSHGALLSY